MRFTREQYEKAQGDIADAMGQIEPNGHGCHVCGDSGHVAYECGSNPLFAMATCKAIAARARELHDELHALEGRADSECVDGPIAEWRERMHEFLHYLGGFDTYMGERTGPAKVRFEPPTGTAW